LKGYAVLLLLLMAHAVGVSKSAGVIPAGREAKGTSDTYIKIGVNNQVLNTYPS
jgi:hypothetical protein